VRTEDRDPESGKAVSDPQAKALIDWCASKDPENAILKAIDQPVLVVCGSDDTMLPDGNAYFMFKHLKSAQLILYPDSGHGTSKISSRERVALHDQYPNAEGLTWTSRQADPARALVLFEDRLTGAALTASGTPTSLLLPDGSAILEVLMLAQRLGVLLTP
jgi:hypothetical protein